MTKGIPRRAQLELNTPAELAIRGAIQAVEEVGVDPLLTDAVVLLGLAREKVADYTDGPDLAAINNITYTLASQIWSAQADLEGHGIEKPFDKLPESTRETYINNARIVIGLLPLGSRLGGG